MFDREGERKKKEERGIERRKGRGRKEKGERGERKEEGVTEGSERRGV